MARNTEIIFDDGALAELLVSPTGPVGDHLKQIGIKGVWIAKSRAPISPRGSEGRPRGYMWSRIISQVGFDPAGLYVDIMSPATTNKGAPYPLFVELGTRPHQIRGYRYVNGARVLHVWDHPGTDAQPYLRPVLDDLRGV